MILVICEKQLIVDSIMSFLPGEREKVGELQRKGNYLFAALGGHALQLKEPEEIDCEKYKDKEWQIETLPIFFEPWPKNPILGNDNKIKEIRNALKTCEYVINAGDNDEEGQLLVDEVLEYCNYTGFVKRLDTADLSEAKLKKCFENLQDYDKWYPLGQSALARQIADKSFGFTMTRYFTLINKNKNVVNVGRVKTPTLGLVVNRELAIQGHEKSKYYTLQSEMPINGNTIILTLSIDKNSDKLVDGKVLDKKILSDIADSISGQTLKGELSIKKENENAPLPFNFNELSKYCNKKFKYSPSDVMDITQSLRDNFKAITYNRTDCQYLSEEHYKEAPKTLATAMKNLGVSFDLDFSIKSKAFNDANITAHHGIIPTDNAFDIKELSVEQKNVYEAICLYYMAQFMPPCVKDKYSFVAKVDDELSFKAHATGIVSDGYRRLFTVDSDNEDNEDGVETTALLNLKAGEYVWTVKGTKIIEKETKPPKRYTEATLLDDMSRIAKYVKDPEMKELLKRKDDGKEGENGSIGTTATRSSIITELINQKYISVDKNKLFATQKGIDLINELPDEVKLADTTAKWWLVQEKISHGQAKVSDLTHAVLDTMKNVMNNSKEVAIGKERTEARIVGKCPLCGKDVVERNDFFGCVGYKDGCEFKIWKNIYGKLIKASVAETLLEKGKTGTIKGFKNKKHKSFDAALMLSDDKKRVVFKFK